MRIAIMQPYFFPYAGYFQLVRSVDKFVFFEDVNFITGGWINRNNILINGESNKITVPLSMASQNKKIYEIQISKDDKWKSKLLKSVEYAYKRAPFFSAIVDMLYDVIMSNHQTIGELAKHSVTAVSSFLKLDTGFSSSLVYENTILKGENRIIDICKAEGAEQYINAPGGSQLYSKHHFQSAGIKLSFLKPSMHTYKQYDHSFIANLSIIDALMFNSPETLKAMLDNYELL